MAPRILVPGGLNTDLIGLGVDHLLSTGELTLGGSFHIGPGGKARNMAQMAAEWMGEGMVAMIGKSVRDPYGLWKVPVESLQQAGVDISGIEILDFEESGGQFPGIALITVDRQGNNQIYCLPGINDHFLPADISARERMFESADQPAYMILAMEIPLETVNAAIGMAAKYSIRVILDPGGISLRKAEIALEQVFLIKPNEHEAEALTGHRISDFGSAHQAAKSLMGMGVHYVLITHGKEGAYLFGEGIAEHIPVPKVPDTGVYDETGCGDQVTATMTACLAEGMEIHQAARMAVWAGTLQFGRRGIEPVEHRTSRIENRESRIEHRESKTDN